MRANFGERFLFKMQKADDDVGDLDAGVVDVVLHVDFVAGGAEQADECVAENGIAQMADVRGLVGIDDGVFDENVALLVTGGVGVGGDTIQLSGGGAVEIRVDVACAGDFEFGEAGERCRAQQQSPAR